MPETTAPAGILPEMRALIAVRFYPLDGAKPVFRQRLNMEAADGTFLGYIGSVMDITEESSPAASSSTTSSRTHSDRLVPMIVRGISTLGSEPRRGTSP